MEDVLDNLNAKILDQCRRHLGRDKMFVDKYSTLDIDKEIDQMTLESYLHADKNNTRKGSGTTFYCVQ